MEASPFCHPERTRISDYVAPEMAACAAFTEESRMKFAGPTKLDRKSGAAEGSAVPRTFLGNVFDRATTPPSLERWRISTKEFREDLEWAVNVRETVRYLLQ